MAKNIHFSDNARNKLYAGVRKLTDAVKVTMGPRGRNVLIQKSYGAPTITKDGVSVAREISLTDALENMGAQLVKEVASNTNDEAGDGTTTATVLAHAIYQEGLRNVTAGANPVQLKRGMDKVTEDILNNLKKISKIVDTKEQIAQVATISANSDTKIGEMIAEAMEKVGKDGVITVEEAKGIYDELDVVEGMQFDRGYLSPYFVNDTEKMIAEFQNPFILLADKKISNLKEILPLLEQTNQTPQRGLVIIAEDIDGEALNTLVMNRIRGALNVVAIKAPGFGDRRKASLEDLAVLTGSTVISDELGIDLSNVGMEVLGTASKIIVDKDNTTIINGAGDEAKIISRVGQIKNELNVVVSDYDKEKLLERLAKLSGGVAVIKVGAPTETEMKEKKDRVDDALSATRAAVEEGIVIGGGAALIKAASKLTIELEGDEQIGAEIIIRAVAAPLKQIAINAGYDSGVVANEVRNSNDDTYGFDAATGTYVDMFKSGIVDPTKVERVAMQNAVSVASLLLTTEATVSDVPEDSVEAQIAPDMGGMGGMGGMGL